MDPIEGEFICRKCQTPLSVLRILVSKKGFALLDVVCSKKHEGKRKLDMQHQNEWMPIVIKHLYSCPRCGANLTDLKQKSEGDVTVLLLNCATHSKIRKIISTSFWYAMDALRKQLAAKPAYPPGYPASYPPAYPPAPYPTTYQTTAITSPPPPSAYPPPPSAYSAPPPSGAYPPTAPPPETISPPKIEGSQLASPPPSSGQKGETSLANQKMCPACGEEITPGAKFCTSCGTEIE